uniref:Uncharacterized protein n=1 Tax=Falco tinnunculus TaxID=100819 RepID=A0A8C4XSQ5_FALTI
MMGQDQKMFLLTGITVAGKKCGVICDSLLVDEGNVLDVRSKGSDSRSICIGKTPKALILLMGEKGVHGGALNQKARADSLPPAHLPHNLNPLLNAALRALCAL